MSIDMDHPQGEIEGAGGVDIRASTPYDDKGFLRPPPIRQVGKTAHVTGPGHISPSELPWQHYTGEGYEGKIEFLVNSQQVTPTHNQPTFVAYLEEVYTALQNKAAIFCGNSPEVVRERYDDGTPSSLLAKILDEIYSRSRDIEASQ